MILKGSLASLKRFASLRPGIFAADVLLPLGAVLGVAGHHNLQRFRLPLGPNAESRQ